MIKKILAFLVLCLLIFAAGGKVRADVNDFMINSFDADYTLSRDDPQGRLRIVERIDVTFTDFNHGILRAIPKTYKQHNLKLQVNNIASSSGAPTQYTTYSSNGNTVLKIGDPNRTVTGAQEYTIDYNVSNVISFYDDHDELYWDINGDQWDQPVQNVNLVIHEPSSARLSNQKPVCYTGLYGGRESNCVIDESAEAHSINMSTTSGLNANQTASIVIGFQKGYFTPSKWYETAGEYTKTALAFLFFPIVIGTGSLWYWFKKGRDPKGRGTIIPEYGPPDDLKPLEVGSLIDYKVDNRDISATIIDLAVNGYIKIIETKKNRLIGKDKLSYTLELMNNNISQLKDFETKILQGIFSTLNLGDTVKLDSLKNDFYKTVKDVRDLVSKDLAARGYFAANPLKAGAVLHGIGVVCLVLGLFLHLFGVAIDLGLILAALIAFLFAVLMRARTQKGAMAKEQVEGLKLYLKTAEADRLKMMQSPDAAYATNHEMPVKTVELFEKLLPYAIVLGVEKQWAKQFESIYTTPPGWYSGNWSTFNAIYLTNSISTNMSTAMNSAFSAPSSSGSSGFGGGGFSGGGGGGGGGGGW